MWGQLLVLVMAAAIATPNPVFRQVGLSEDVGVVVKNEAHVCVVDGEIFRAGEYVPTADPCETCMCRPPGFACTLTSCEYKPGCRALLRADTCCPDFRCDCEYEGSFYENGEFIDDPTRPCERCQCRGGEVVCSVIRCRWEPDCDGIYTPGLCCPSYDHCPVGEVERVQPEEEDPAAVPAGDDTGAAAVAAAAEAQTEASESQTEVYETNEPEASVAVEQPDNLTETSDQVSDAVVKNSEPETVDTAQVSEAEVVTEASELHTEVAEAAEAVTEAEVLASEAKTEENIEALVAATESPVIDAAVAETDAPIEHSEALTEAAEAVTEAADAQTETPDEIPEALLAEESETSQTPEKPAETADKSTIPLADELQVKFQALSTNQVSHVVAPSLPLEETYSETRNEEPQGADTETVTNAPVAELAEAVTEADPANTESDPQGEAGIIEEAVIAETEATAEAALAETEAPLEAVVAETQAPAEAGLDETQELAEAIEVLTETPVDKVGEAEAEPPVEPSEAVTDSPVEPSEAVTDSPVEPSEAKTDSPVEPSEAVTELPVEPSEAETSAPVEPSEAETDKPIEAAIADTEAPIAEALEAETEAPSETGQAKGETTDDVTDAPIEPAEAETEVITEAAEAQTSYPEEAAEAVTFKPEEGDITKTKEETHVEASHAQTSAVQNDQEAVTEAFNMFPSDDSKIAVGTVTASVNGGNYQEISQVSENQESQNQENQATQNQNQEGQNQESQQNQDRETASEGDSSKQQSSQAAVNADDEYWLKMNEGNNSPQQTETEGQLAVKNDQVGENGNPVEKELEKVAHKYGLKPAAAKPAEESGNSNESEVVVETKLFSNPKEPVAEYPTNELRRKRNLLDQVAQYVGSFF